MRRQENKSQIASQKARGLRFYGVKKQGVLRPGERWVEVGKR